MIYDYVSCTGSKYINHQLWRSWNERYAFIIIIFYVIDMLDVLDRLLTTLDKQTTVKDELIPAAGNKDSPLMKDGDTKNGE